MRICFQVGAILLVVCIAACGAAHANTFMPFVGLWNVDGNWSTGFIPGANEDVLIPSGHHAVMSPTDLYPQANAGTLTVESDASVDVSPTTDFDGILNLGSQGFLFSVEHIINGAVILHASVGSHNAVIFFRPADHIFLEGAGEIGGLDNLAQLDIGGGELNNRITIRGRLKITGSTLLNQGRIKADSAGGTLLIEPFYLGDADNSSTSPLAPEYQAESGGTLEFGSGISGITNANQVLVGDFAVGLLFSDATLLMNKAITSTGHLEMKAGLVDVNQDFFLNSLNSVNRNLSMTGGIIDVAPSKQFTHE